MITSSLKLCWRQQNLIHLYTQGPIRKKIWASFKYLFSRGSYSVNFNYMNSPKPILIMLLITRLTEKPRLYLTTYIKKKYPPSSKKNLFILSENLLLKSHFIQNIWEIWNIPYDWLPYMHWFKLIFSETA